MCREESAVSPILSAADEKSLDRHRSTLAREREHVGIAEALGVHRLAALDVGERAQPVAVDGREFEVLPLGGVRHGARQPRLDAGRFAGEKLLRLPDELAIFLLADPAHARRRAALDLIKEAWPRSVLEIAVRTAS